MDRCVINPAFDPNTYDVDGPYRWFDRDKAECFTERTDWNGHNHISCATGSQWDHQDLYRTTGGKWILGYDSAWQGSIDGFREITAAEAASWLVRNHYGDHPACAAEYAALEIA